MILAIIWGRDSFDKFGLGITQKYHVDEKSPDCRIEMSKDHEIEKREKFSYWKS